MKLNRTKKTAFILAGVLVLSAVATPQLRQILRAGGVVAAISAFGKDMNNGINKLWNRGENPNLKTKVVPILSVRLTGGEQAIGAAQVMGPPAQVDKVVAVAQPEARILGNEIRLRALIPVSSRDVVRDIRAVDGVGVSGIVDIRL